MSGPILALEGLSIAYRSGGYWLDAVSEVSLAIAPGEAYGLVGESGCGKSTVAMAAMGYLPTNARVSAGRIRLAGSDIAGLDAKVEWGVSRTTRVPPSSSLRKSARRVWTSSSVIRSSTTICRGTRNGSNSGSGGATGTDNASMWWSSIF